MTLVSVITASYQRNDILRSRCIPSVQTQTYQPVEHIIIHDGPNDELMQLNGVITGCLPDHVGDRGQACRLRAIELSHGELIAYLDDDNSWRENHVAVLADALLRSNADFAYSQMQVHGGRLNVDIIGTEPPSIVGSLDTSLIMHRKSALQHGSWHDTGFMGDWPMVQRWLAAGLSYVFIPQITVDYY